MCEKFLYVFEGAELSASDRELLVVPDLTPAGSAVPAGAVTDGTTPGAPVVGPDPSGPGR